MIADGVDAAWEDVAPILPLAAACVLFEARSRGVEMWWRRDQFRERTRMRTDGSGNVVAWREPFYMLIVEMVPRDMRVMFATAGFKPHGAVRNAFAWVQEDEP